MHFKQHIVLAFAFAAAAQTPLHFEVASAKPSDPAAGPRFTMSGGPGTPDPTRVRYANVPLRRVLLTAYDLPNYRLLGPDWLNTLRYDIEAAVPAGATAQLFQEMLRSLLAERFHIQSHLERKEVPIYALLAGKNGIKIKAVSADPVAPTDQLAAVGGEGRDGFPKVTLPGSGMVIETKNGAARITAREVSFPRLADFLTTQVGRPVVDSTATPGAFTFELYFSPETAAPSDSTEPTIFAAVQEQLGLRLDPRRGPIEYFVVDQALKVPVQN